MATRQAKAQWNGTLKEGNGTFTLPGANFEGAYTFASRFEESTGTNPEELAGAALASCFSMFVSALLSKQNLTPDAIQTTATVELGTEDGGPKITEIQLNTEVRVANISDQDFQEVIETAKQNCPISKLFTGTTLNVEAKLVQLEEAN